MRYVYRLFLGRCYFHSSLIVQRNEIYEVVELCLVNRMIKCFKPNLKIMNLTKCEVAAPHHHTMTSLAFHSQCVGRTFLYLTFMIILYSDVMVHYLVLKFEDSLLTNIC